MPAKAENQEDIKALTEEIVGLYDQVVDRVGKLRGETAEMLSDFREEQEGLKKRLKGNLAKGESLRKKDFDLLISDLIARRKEREKEVAEMLGNFAKEEEEMTQGLRKLLEKGGQVRIKDFKKMLSRIRRRQEERSGEVAELAGSVGVIKEEAAKMLSEFKKEREEMAGHWAKLTETMRTKRAGQ